MRGNLGSDCVLKYESTASEPQFARRARPKSQPQPPLSSAKSANFTAKTHGTICTRSPTRVMAKSWEALPAGTRMQPWEAG